jgi:heme-degrading monooxygenase HmoA
MFVNVGRFHFRPMNQDERQGLIRQIEQDIPPMVQKASGFRGVYFVNPSDDEVMTVWLWDSEADWDAAFAEMGPLLQEYVVPNLSQPPDRISGDAVLEIMP